MLADSYVGATIPVTNMAQARQFYEGILGLIPVDAVPNFGLVAYQTTVGHMVAIYERETATSGQHTAINFFVEDLSKTADELIAKGVTLETYDLPPDAPIQFDKRGVIYENGEPQVLFIKDPDANWIAISFLRRDFADALKFRRR